MSKQQTPKNAQETSSSRTAGTPGSGTEMPAASPPAATAPLFSESAEPASAPPATASDTVTSSPGFSTERLRDFVGAFVLAGLDPRIGSETEFFADRVQYYDEGVISREKICKDLERYAARWPERRFWLDGDIQVDPQNGKPVRVTFPLRYELRNGAKHSSVKISKTLVLKPTGDDPQLGDVHEAE